MIAQFETWKTWLSKCSPGHIKSLTDSGARSLWEPSASPCCVGFQVRQNMQILLPCGLGSAGEMVSCFSCPARPPWSPMQQLALPLSCKAGAVSFSMGWLGAICSWCGEPRGKRKNLRDQPLCCRWKVVFLEECNSIHLDPGRTGKENSRHWMFCPPEFHAWQS